MAWACTRAGRPRFPSLIGSSKTLNDKTVATDDRRFPSLIGSSKTAQSILLLLEISMVSIPHRKFKNDRSRIDIYVIAQFPSLIGSSKTQWRPD